MHAKKTQSHLGKLNEAQLCLQHLPLKQCVGQLNNIQVHVPGRLLNQREQEDSTRRNICLNKNTRLELTAAYINKKGGVCDLYNIINHISTASYEVTSDKQHNNVKPA